MSFITCCDDYFSTLSSPQFNHRRVFVQFKKKTVSVVTMADLLVHCDLYYVQKVTQLMKKKNQTKNKYKQ